MNDERQGERSLVLQDLPNMELKVANAGIWWKTLEVWEHWQLQRHVLTGHFRILDGNDVRKAWGGEQKMRMAFAKLKDSL